jgi:hypothetical protein
VKNHDFAPGSRKGLRLDVRSFARWFTQANKGLFRVERVTVRDSTDFRDHLRREQARRLPLSTNATATTSSKTASTRHHNDNS